MLKEEWREREMVKERKVGRGLDMSTDGGRNGERGDREESWGVRRRRLVVLMGGGKEIGRKLRKRTIAH